MNDKSKKAKIPEETLSAENDEKDVASEAPQADASKAEAASAKPKKYKVTGKAGHFVAGIRNPGVGKSVTLTEQQAQYPLLNGEIEAA